MNDTAKRFYMVAFWPDELNAGQFYGSISATDGDVCLKHEQTYLDTANLYANLRDVFSAEMADLIRDKVSASKYEDMVALTSEQAARLGCR
jgi:hypothetical protein